MVEERDAILAESAGFGASAAHRRVTSKRGIR